MNYNLVLSDKRFLESRAGFSAQELLQRLNSPRLVDMPDLGAWIDGAADDAGVSRELMCVVPQKEQSALTLPTLTSWAKTAFCGYGVYSPGILPRPEWQGPKKQLYAAALGLKSLFTRALEGRSEWYATVDEHFPKAGVTPENRATAALYTYTPSKSDKTNIQEIWRLFNLGDPLEDVATISPTEPTADLVAKIARNAADSKQAGQSRMSYNGVQFDLVAGGWCLRFVRQCYAAAQRAVDPSCDERDYDAFPWLNRYASQACRTLQKGGRGTFGAFGPTSEPSPGDIIGISPGYTVPGHIGIFLGRGLFAENTSSTARGPGTVISEIEEVQSRVTGYYRVLSSVAQEDLKVVAPDGTVIGCAPHWDDERIICTARPLIEALGYGAYYRVLEDGRKRLYIKEE